MLTENKIKEEISFAYVQTAAAVKSYQTEIPHTDNDEE